MATLQKTLAAIRELQDEELDMVGGLVGTTITTEEWEYCQPKGSPSGTWVMDKVTTSTKDD